MRASLLTPIVEAAHACNLRVAAHVETATAREACQAGVDSLERLVNAIEPAWTPRHAPELYPGAVGRLRRWAYVDLGSDHVTDFVDLVCAQQVTLVPTLLASRRRVLLDEVINEPYLDYMVAVMPYHRFFKGMRNAVGYAIGKRFLNRHIPFPHLDKAAQHEIDQGWQRLRQLMRLLHQRGARMVPGSDSPTPSVVPGFGLHQELREWVACGIPPLAVLAAATAHAADFLGLERVGRIRPGASADLLLVDGDPDCAIEALAAPDNQVICRGQRIDRAALKAAIMARVKELE
ncbi:amidohydrolase family protein [Kallotenue papyrolyticum]|uniref:amidohydrolase family protein n=1 Tax=Kallotenue papyrolyticum TaxID=1325125 RepID=UPI0004924C17|nr:amidohydrolase family protein [Kallotenue papyrolyticum]